MRDDSTLVSQLRDIQVWLDELKTAQLVGNSQIRVKEYVSETITATSTSTGYTSEAFANCIVLAPEIMQGNILITHCVPEVRTANNTLIDNKTDGRSVNITSVEIDQDYANAYQANIYHTSTGGETIPAESYTVRFHIYSAALVSITASGGQYGS